jgi:hypothetical protein
MRQSIRSRGAQNHTTLNIAVKVVESGSGVSPLQFRRTALKKPDLQQQRRMFFSFIPLSDWCTLPAKWNDPM